MRRNRLQALQGPAKPGDDRDVVRVAAMDVDGRSVRRSTIDPGAGMSNCPKSVAAPGRKIEGREVARLDAVSGATIAQRESRRIPITTSGSGGKCEMDVCVTDLVKPLAAALAIAGAENAAVFGKNESFSEDMRIGKRSMLQRDRGTCMIEVGAKSVGVMGVQVEASQVSMRQECVHT